MRKRHGIIPSLLAPNEGEITRECRENNIEVFCKKFYNWMCSSRIRSILKTSVKQFLNQIILYRNILNSLKDKHFDLVHTNYSLTDIGSLIAQNFEIPHIWHIREYGKDDYDLHYVMPASYVRSKYANSDAVIAISESMYDSLINWQKLLPPEKTRIIYNGLRVPESYTKHQPGEKINFCIVGGVQAGKNQEMAIKACAKLKALTDNFTLHIIGSGSEKYVEQMKQLVTSLRLDDCIKFWGFRSDVNQILHDMDVGLMLSKREAFGRVTVEYMLNYMPVIGVNTGATPEIVIDGETGYICPIDDSEKLAELMHKFITNPELITSMGNKGRERAVNNFSLERNTDEIYSLYQEILSR